MTESTASPAAASWFIRLLAGAAIAHIAGNPPFSLDVRGWVTLALGLVASLALVAPAGRTIRIALGLLILATVWLEAPFIGNHWVVAGFVAVALLGSSLREDWWVNFAPTGRAILLAFYAFAAFAKLNAGFFDPVESCGLFYANQSLISWDLPQIASGGVWAQAVAAASALVELSVPVLLVIRRTRTYGLMLAFGFHFLVSLDLGQHFFDFSALLFALFTLFIDEDITSRWEATMARHGPAMAALAASSGLLTVAAVVSPRALTVWAVQAGVFFVWIPVGAMLVVAVVRTPRKALGVIRLVPSGIVGGILVAVVVFNGLTPYLGLKTGYGFNMYANLHTADGESNHYLIRSSAELVDLPLVTVVEASDEGLAQYIGSEYLVPERNVLDQLAENPDATVTYVRDGEVISGTGADLGQPLPLLVEKFGLFRSVDSRQPPRCQTVWLPAN